MDPTVLAWALAQLTGTYAAVLAAAFTGGTTPVTFDGRAVEYRLRHPSGRLQRPTAGCCPRLIIETASHGHLKPIGNFRHFDGHAP